MIFETFTEECQVYYKFSIDLGFKLTGETMPAPNNIKSSRLLNLLI